jgi:TolA-binding protein
VSLKGMGKTPEACNVFRDLTVKYPRASASTRTLAANEARTAQCR